LISRYRRSNATRPAADSNPKPDSIVLLVAEKGYPNPSESELTKQTEDKKEE